MISTRTVEDKRREREGQTRKGVHLAYNIFQEYSRDIRNFIISQVKDQSKADDIFQDFFLSLIKKPIPEYIQDPKGYLFVAVKNDILDSMRKTKSYNNKVCRFAESGMCTRQTSSPEKLVSHTEQSQKLFEIIEEYLPRHEAQALIHRYKDDLDSNEAASYMNVNRRTYSRIRVHGPEETKRKKQPR